MYHVVFLLGGLVYAPLGWPLAWLAAWTFCKVQHQISAARLRLLVMAIFGIMQSMLIFVDDYWDVPASYTWGLSSMVGAYAVGWFITAAAIEFAIRAIAARRAISSSA